MSLNTLRIQREAIALEAFAVSDISSVLGGLIPGMIATFSKFTAGFAPTEQGVHLTSRQAAFIKDVNKADYMDLMSGPAVVPEGLKVSFADYLRALDRSVDHACGIMDKVLAPYSMFLSHLINSKDEKFNTRSHESFYKGLDQDRQSALKLLTPCFENSSHRTDTTYGRVVARNGEWNDVFKFADQYMRQVNTIDRKALDKKVKECADLLNIVMEKIKRQELDGASPQVVQRLADGAYAIASELEFFSVTYYKVMAITEAINQTVQATEKALDQVVKA